MLGGWLVGRIRLCLLKQIVLNYLRCCKAESELQFLSSLASKESEATSVVLRRMSFAIVQLQV